jgi:hypothetical protein
MKKYSVAILAAVFGMATFAMGAKAATSDQLLVKVPYDFVVGDKTLPAGTYRVSRLSFNNEGALALNSVDGHAGVLLSASMWVDARTSEPRLKFEEIDGKYFLSAIQTDEHVFTIPVSKSAVMLAMKSHEGSPASSGAGTD